MEEIKQDEGGKDCQLVLSEFREDFGEMLFEPLLGELKLLCRFRGLSTPSRGHSKCMKLRQKLLRRKWKTMR